MNTMSKLLQIHTLDEEDELRLAFRTFDKHKTGTIDVLELRHALTVLGDKMTTQEVDAFFRDANIYGKEAFTYEDYISMLFPL